jgi:spore germination protein GerM
VDKKGWILLGLSLILLLVLVFIFFRGGGREEISPLSETLPSKSALESEQPREVKMVTVFFLSEEDGLLHAELRQIAAGPNDVQEAERVIEQLIRGSDKGFLSALPAETQLRQLFITDNGVAYVDFSKEFVEKHPSGSSAEMATVYSVVNSLAYNFKSIKKVFILVEGGEKETLGGHISLSEAFAPLYSLDAQ